MFFPERQLKPYAKSVEPSKLQIGDVYYTVGFVDDQMLVPVMNSLVYIGKETEMGVKFIFQDASSYFSGVDFKDNACVEKCDLFECSSDGLAGVYSFDEALNALLRCSLRHDRAPDG